MSRNDDIDLIVKEYLLAKGYSKAAAELDRETLEICEDNEASNTKDLTRRILSSMTSIANESSRLGLKQSDSFHFISNYDSFRSWAINSLDIVKPQLLALCFPLFVHCYIGLVELNGSEINQSSDSKNVDSVDAIKQFWNCWSGDFIDTYSDELASLSTLTNKEQLENTDFLEGQQFISCALKNKFQVPLTSLAYKLLTSYLLENTLVVIAAIVNTKIRFVKVSDTVTQTSSYMDTDNKQDGVEIKHEISKVELDGYTPATTSSSMLSPLTLGVPGREIVGGGNKASTGSGTSTSTTTNVMCRDTQMPDTREDPLYRDWLQYLVRPLCILEQHQQKSGEDRDIKRPKTDPSTTAYSDLSERLSSTHKDDKKYEIIGNPHQPSILFATIANTYENMTCMDINQKATMCVTGHKDSCVRVWDLKQQDDKSGDDRVRFEFDTVMPASRGSDIASRPYNNIPTPSNTTLNTPSNLCELRGHRMPVYGVSQDKNGRLVLSCSADESIRLWDLKVSQCVGKYTCVSPAWDIQFSPLGYYFASANQDKTVTLYSTDRVAPIRMFTGHISDVNCVSFHPNNLYIASGSDDGTARLYDIRSGQSMRVMTGSNQPVCSVDISKNGSLLAIGNENGKILIYDLSTTKLLSVLHGHKKAVNSLSFSECDTALVSGSSDCSVCVWDVNSVSEQQQKVWNVQSQCEDSLAATSTQNSPESYLQQLLLRPIHTFYTKFSPVFYCGFTAQNVVLAGGPFSSKTATAYRESLTVEAGNGARSDHTNAPTAAETTLEQDTVQALGISRATVAAVKRV